MEIPMLDEEEYQQAIKLYGAGMQRFREGEMAREDRFKALLDYYHQVTGFIETEPNAIMHHRIAQ
jgi:hypothetical protein